MIQEIVWLLFVMLHSLRVLAQGASLLNGLEFDPLTFFQDSLAGPEVDVERREIVDVPWSAVVVIHGANQNGNSLTNGIGIRNLTEILHRDGMATGGALPIGLTSEGWLNKFSVKFLKDKFS